MSEGTVTTEQVRSKRVELIVHQLEALPTLPVVAAKLLQAATAKDTSVKDIVSLISTDQSLTAKVLALTRRAHLGLRNNVTTVEKAVVMMGLEAVRNAVLSIQVFETFGPKDKGGGEGGGFDRLEFWKHSLAVACTAELIAEQQRSRKVNADEAFVCGLLHDIGKVVFDFCLPKSFARVVKVAESNRVNIVDVERRILGLDHAAIGKKLAEKWRLPDTVLHAVWLHHHKSAMLPETVKHRELVDVLYLADLIAREQRIGFSGNYVFVEHSEPFARQLGLSAQAYEQVVLELRKRMSRRAELIGLEDLSTEELYQQALQVANAELGKVNQSLTTVNRRLNARARYFDAINEINRRLKPDMAIMEMLEQMAGALGKALNLPALVVYRENHENGFIEAAFAQGEQTETQLFEIPSRGAALPDLAGESLLVDPPEFLEPVIGHYATRLGSAGLKLIPLVAAGQHIGGIVSSCDDATCEQLGRESQEVEALTTACSLVLGQSLVAEAKDQLADNLLTLSRQAQELEEKLVASRCMGAVGQLAAGAAHELNNPLAIISGRAQLLRDHESDAEKRKPLDIIVEQSHHASEIVTELMAFTQPVAPSPQVVDVGEAIKEAMGGLDAAQLNRRQVCVDVQGDAGTAYCDPDHLAAMLKELLANAMASSDREDLQVKIQTVAEDDHKHMQVRVEDNGVGMGPDVLHKATDLFFSAQPAGRKRGLGLPRVYRYAQANEGSFWLESQVDVGTTAFVRLPMQSPTN